MGLQDGRWLAAPSQADDETILSETFEAAHKSIRRRHGNVEGVSPKFNIYLAVKRKTLPNPQRQSEYDRLSLLENVG